MLPSILLFSPCIALLFHATRKKLFYPYSLLWEGVDFISIYTYTYISFKNIFYHPSCFSHFKLQKNAIGSLISFLEGLISVYFSINSSINFHGSINPCFWEGVDVACQMLHVNSSFSCCIALLFHAARKNYSTLIHSFGRGLILFLYIHIFLSRISSIIPHVSPIPNFRKMPLDHSCPFWRD